MASAAATLEKRAQAANATVSEKLKSLQEKSTVYKSSNSSHGSQARLSVKR